MRECKICGTAFEPVNSVQLCCSKACSARNKAILQYKRRYGGDECKPSERDKTLAHLAARDAAYDKAFGSGVTSRQKDGSRSIEIRGRAASGRTFGGPPRISRLSYFF